MRVRRSGHVHMAARDLARWRNSDTRSGAHRALKCPRDVVCRVMRRVDKAPTIENALDDVNRTHRTARELPYVVGSSLNYRAWWTVSECLIWQTA